MENSNANANANANETETENVHENENERENGKEKTHVSTSLIYGSMLIISIASALIVALLVFDFAHLAMWCGELAVALALLVAAVATCLGFALFK